MKYYILLKDRNMLLKRSGLLLTILLLPFCNIIAQDRLFSQFYNAPLLMNPAYTGFMDQDYRAQAIYRSQWQQVVPYKTFGASGDLNVPLPANPNAKIGVGLVFFHDQMSEIMIDNTVMLSLSYIRVLDRAKRQKLSFGLQGGYVNKNVDYSKLYFENQIGSDHSINTSTPSGENIGNEKINYVTANAGVAYSLHVNHRLEVRAGLSAFNLTSPKESFEQNAGTTIDRLKSRMVFTAGAKYQLANRWYLFPEALVVIQQGAKEINLGSGIGYSLDRDAQKNIMLMAGAWYRTNGAAIGMLGMGYQNATLMLSYDQITSSLKDAAISGRAMNAYELSFTYKGFLHRAIAPKHAIPCGIY